MTVWTPEQMAAVRGTTAQAVVPHPALHRDPDAAVAAARTEVARNLIEACRVHAVEVHPGDIAFGVTLAPNSLGTVISGSWQPSTREVEFYGGPLDGRVYAIQNAPQAVNVAVAPPMAPWHRPDAADIALAPETMRYAVDGWRESARRWVYRPASGSM